jgi:F-type H+-transporting ATPase subunit delta
MAELATIARPYAEAAFKLAREKSTLAGWSDALGLLEVMVQDARMQACISDPNVSPQALESLVLGVAGDRLDGAVRNFVQLLIENGRFELLAGIRAQFEALRREHEGVLEARIVSALPLADEQVNGLVARLEARHQRKVRARVEIDPQLIGGVMIIVGDKVIDGTVRGRLEAMAAALAH